MKSRSIIDSIRDGKRTRATWIQVAALSTAFLVLPDLALAGLSKSGDASVSFVAVGAGGLKFEGKTSELAVAEADGKVTISVPLAGLDTGIGLRNRHMREKYLEVDKFPRAELVVERTALAVPSEGATVAGLMTMHGKTKTVAIHYTARKAGDGYAVSGTAHIDMRDFGIEVPSYLGVTVKPGVDIEVRFSAVQR